MADTKDITIHGITFTLSAPYAEGHTCTAAEAKALNQTRAENIGNNMRKLVKASIDGEADALDEAGLRAKFAEYDANYEFTLAAAGGGRSTMTPVEKEARRLAKAILVSKLKEAGKTLKEYTEANGKDAVDSKVIEISEMDAVVTLAKKNVKAAEQTANSGLEVAV